MEVRTAIIDVVAEAGEIIDVEVVIVPSLLMTKLHSSPIAVRMTSSFTAHERGGFSRIPFAV